MKLFVASLITLSLMASFVFFVIILALIYLDAVNIYFAIGLTVIINVVLWLVGPALTDWLNKWLYKVEFLTPDEVHARYPEVAALIQQVSDEHKFKFPKIGIIPDKNPTAFTYGSARYNARIVLTEGIFHYLNPQEARAVVGHELGHVVNRDFIVMMIASTLVQVLYEIYAVLIRSRGKKSGNAKLIALVAYALYFVATYLLLFLSRTRETLADEFSAKVTSAQDLAHGLIKIAYGIVAEPDEASSKKLLESTRHLGVVDVKNAKHIGAVSYITHNDPNILSEVMVFDKVNPWAMVIEFNSTHPLTGNRLDHLSTISKQRGQAFSYDVQGAIHRMAIKKDKLYSGFTLGVLVYFAPILLGLFSLLFFDFVMLPAAIGLGLLIKVMYRYPSGRVAETTILDEMRNPYASPARGKLVHLQGQVIGKGIPGYVFGEDMMFQDRTGMTFLNYESPFSFIGNIFFALSKLKTLIGVPSSAQGWFFRGMSSMIALKSLHTEKETINSYPMLWAMVLPIFLIFFSIVWYVFSYA